MPLSQAQSKPLGAVELGLGAWAINGRKRRDFGSTVGADDDALDRHYAWIRDLEHEFPENTASKAYRNGCQGCCPPIASDRAGEIAPASWGDLMSERHRFCTQYLPKDSRNLLFFVEDGAANQWLSFGSNEHYIAEGLGR